MPKLAEIDGGKIKPLNYTHDFEEWQKHELKKCLFDPVYFIKNYVQIQHPVKGAIPFQLFDYQEDLIRTYHENRKVIGLMPRQTGKTTTAAAYLLWFAIFQKDQQILITSKDQDGANEIMERLWYAYEELPWWIKPGVKVNQVKKKEFDNGSKIRSVATTATSGRGKSNSLIYCDEFAYVRPGISDKFWTAIQPSLSTGGKCIITSTPNTDEDKFAQIWFNSLPSPQSDIWEDSAMSREMLEKIEANREKYDTIYEDKALAALMDDEISEEEDDDPDAVMAEFISFYAKWNRAPDERGNPRGAAFKRGVIKSGFTEEQWKREYECSFISGDSTLISGMKLAMLKYQVRPARFVDRWGGRWYEEIKPMQAYALVMDPSEGIGLDDACIQVWEIPTLRQVFEWNSNTADQPEPAKMIRRTLQRIYEIQQNDPRHDGSNNLYYSVERNGPGIGILRAIELAEERLIPGHLVDATATSLHVKGSSLRDQLNKWRGIFTTVGSKKRYCLEFKSLVERNLFVPRSDKLVSQLKTFVKSKNSWGAKEGAKDDIVMSCVVMCHLIDELRTHEPDLDDWITPELDDYDPDDEDHPDNLPMLPII